MGSGTVATTPSTPVTTVHSIGDALGQTPGDMLGRYASYNPGASSIDGVSPNVPTKLSAYGTPSMHDYSQTDDTPSQRFAGAISTSHDPASVTAFGGMLAKTAEIRNNRQARVRPVLHAG